MPFIFSQNKSAPLLKAASVKMLGYMVYYDLGEIFDHKEGDS